MQSHKGNSNRSGSRQEKTPPENFEAHGDNQWQARTYLSHREESRFPFEEIDVTYLASNMLTTFRTLIQGATAPLDLQDLVHKRNGARGVPPHPDFANSYSFTWNFLLGHYYRLLASSIRDGFSR